MNAVPNPAWSMASVKVVAWSGAVPEQAAVTVGELGAVVDGYIALSGSFTNILYSA